jgi:hypothetical protein
MGKADCANLMNAACTVVNSDLSFCDFHQASGQILALVGIHGSKVFALLTISSFEVVWSASVVITQVDQLFI